MITLTVFGAALLVAYYFADRLDRLDEGARRRRAGAQGGK